MNFLELPELIELIYQGATDFSRWPVIVEAINQWVGASTCWLLTPHKNPDDGGLLVTHGFSQQTNTLWATKFCAHDLWAQRALEKNVLTTGNVVRDQDLVTDQEFLDSIWYKEFLSELGLGRLIAGVVFSEQDIVATPVMCSCMRPFDQPFSAADVEKMKALLPHLSRALGTLFRLREAESKHASALLALDRITHGTLLFDKDGRIIFLNAAAWNLIDMNDGLGLRNGTEEDFSVELVASNEKTNRLLVEAIKAAISPDTLPTQHIFRAVVIPRPSGNSAFLINFSSLASSTEPGTSIGNPRAIAFITDCAATVRLNGNALKDAYGLTEAEVRAADFLVNGCSIEQVARNLGVSANTIKSHMRQLHEKTGVNNRAKLVKLLLSMTNA